MRPHLPLWQAIRRYTPPSSKPVAASDTFWPFFRSIRLRIIGEPTVKNQQIRDSLSAMPKAGFYAVHTGHNPGIYRSWPEAEAQVKGFPAAKYKKFPSEAAAQVYMQGVSAGPYSAPNRSSAIASPGAASSSRTTSAPQRAPISKPSDPGSSSRAGSPPTSIDPVLLPPDLQAVAAKGYTFSKDKRLVVYTDGSGLGNGQIGARAGLGVYWGTEGDAGKRNLAERVPGALQTNNRGELLSVIRAVELCPYPNLPLEIRTDSQYTISCMTTYLPAWIRSNFRPSKGKSRAQANSTKSAGRDGESKQVKNADLIKHLLVLLRRRGRAGVKFKYVAAHVGWEGNEAADRLAKMGASMPPVPDRTDWLDPDKEDDVLDAVAHPANREVNENEGTDIDVEIDESWLLTVEELEALERDFKLEPAEQIAV